MPSASKVRIANPTSIYGQERLNPKAYGANPTKGLLPFQVFIKVGDQVQSHPNGLSWGTIQRLSNKGYKSNQETMCLFYPNQIETYLKQVKDENDPEKVSWMRVSAYQKSEGQKERLARINYCFVDIDFKDCKTDQERYELVDLVDNPPIRPSVVIHSGNGFHCYFSVKSIPLLDYDEPKRTWVEERFRQVQLSLCKVFRGDSSVANRLTGKMRIPGTHNVKVRDGQVVAARCEYYPNYRGRLEEGRSNPDFTLEDLELELGIDPGQEPGWGYEVEHRPKKPRTPKPKYAGFANFLRKVETNLNLKFRAFEREYLKFIYGHRDLGKIIDATFRRKRSEQGKSWSGSSRKQVREKMVKLGLIEEEVVKFKLRERLGWEYRLTERFFQLGDISRKSHLQRFKASALQKVNSYPYEAHARMRKHDTGGKLVGGIDYDYPLLRGAGYSHQETASILKAKIDNRPAGLPRGEAEKRYIDDWEGFYDPNYRAS